MRTYKTETITREHTYIDRVHCDLCGAVGREGEWASGIYEVNQTILEVIVHQKDGASYPSGGWGTEYVVDLCPKCFLERLVPWLNSQGAKLEQKEWDW